MWADRPSQFRSPADWDIEIDGRKIVDYLLDPGHPQGGPKARFFRSFGFERDEPEVMARHLMDHFRQAPLASVVENVWGHRVCVDGPLDTPSGRTPMVRTVWQVVIGDLTAHFVTAKPLRRP